MGFGDIIRARREEQGLSQERLAQLALTSTRTIARIESGVTKRPGGETLERIAAALGLPRDFFADDPIDVRRRALGRRVARLLPGRREAA